MAKKLLLLLLAVALLPGCERLLEVYNSIKTGAPCTDNLLCLDGECLTESQGFPGGMCTGFDCEESGCWSLTAQCFRTNVGNQQQTLCIPTCMNGRTCERASDGYDCRILDDQSVCLPVGASIKTEVPGITGAACTVSSECNGSDRPPICMTDFKNGYCSQENCTIGGQDCLNQEPCVHSDPKDSKSKTICMKGCQSDNDCRYGYSCQDFGGTKVCLPVKSVKTKNPNGNDDGGLCNSNLQCKGGTCIRENGGEKPEKNQTDVPYPGGYCTTRDCTSEEDCNGNSICVSRARHRACFAKCTSDNDCRRGYKCKDAVDGKICDSVTPLPEVKVDNVSDVKVTCQASGDLKFNIPNGAIGFYIAPFTKTGQRIQPGTMTLPDKSTLNIPSEYSFLSVNADLLGSITPLLFPASDESKFKTRFAQSGAYNLRVNSPAQEVCYYVIPKMSEGSKLQVRMYFVGVPGINASNASSNRNVQSLLNTMRSIYSQMGVSVTAADYADVSSTVAARYSLIRNFNDVFALVATSESKGTSLTDNLVVNVFLIQDFAISEAPGLLGVSTGIPGLAGMNGTIGSGLVFSTASLGSNNAQLGQTMAHEIGHFLSLRHTTEHKDEHRPPVHDPITDTGECSSPELQYACPDAKNFMFAYAMGKDQTKATKGQGFVVRHNPLVR